MKEAMQSIFDYIPNPDTYYMLCPAQSGDTFVCAGFRQAIERRLKAPIHFLIKKRHEVVMKLYGIKNFTIVDVNVPVNSPQLVALSDLCPRFRKGGVFVAHGSCHKELPLFQVAAERVPHVMDVWTYVLDLPLSARAEFAPPSSNFCKSLKISKIFLEKINDLGGFDSIVLFAPEASSIPLACNEFWEREADFWRRKEKHVVVNGIKPINIRGGEYIKMSYEEAVYLALHCYKTICLRSGFADLILFFRQDVKLIYTDYFRYHFFNVPYMYNLRPEEIILPEGELRDDEGIPYSVRRDCSLKLKLRLWWIRIRMLLAGRNGRRNLKKEKVELKKRIRKVREYCFTR